jgi:hypothetical protein
VAGRAAGGSRALELRAGLGWGCFLLRRGRTTDVLRILAPVVEDRDQMETSDLLAARELLHSLE